MKHGNAAKIKTTFPLGKSFIEHAGQIPPAVEDAGNVHAVHRRRIINQIIANWKRTNTLSKFRAQSPDARLFGRQSAGFFKRIEETVRRTGLWSKM
jgi:hypothetical protein